MVGSEECCFGTFLESLISEEAGLGELEDLVDLVLDTVVVGVGSDVEYVFSGVQLLDLLVSLVVTDLATVRSRLLRALVGSHRFLARSVIKEAGAA